MQNQIKVTEKDEENKPKKKQKIKNCSCPFNKKTLIDDLSGLALNEILDVEDLVKYGKELKACPYYASRKASKDAQIIFVPYNTILHKSTREANGILYLFFKLHCL